MPEFVHLLSQSGRLVLTSPDIAAEEHFVHETTTRKDLIFGLPDATQDLDLSRTSTYAVANGLSSDKPIKYLDERNYAIATAGSESSGHSEGMYIHIIGILLLKRNVMLESLNGHAITESFTIHERAHSTHAPTPIEMLHSVGGKLFWKRHLTNADKTRSGFGFNARHKGRGVFLEEAYAELERGLFVEHFDLIDDFTAGANNYDKAKQSGIPMKYFYKHVLPDGTSSLTLAPGALPVIVLDAFIESDSENLQIMRSARRDTEGLRQFIQKLNTFMPGLYARLLHTDTEDVVNLIKNLR
jgi:hypothetical protein